MHDKKSADFICTPNHWWLVKRERKNSWEFVEADQLYPQMCYPKAAPHKFTGKSLLTTDDAAILGWVITDGTYNKELARMYIQQDSGPYSDDIRELLERNKCLVSDRIYVVKSYYEVHFFRLTSEKREYLIDMMERHGLAYIVTHLSEEAANAMWEAMYKAEGKKDGGGFVQKAGNVLTAFELLSFVVGRFVTVNFHSAPDIWTLYPHKSKQFHNKDLKLDKVHYKGKMWCPRVEHRTILIRRNNKVRWSGNTYESQRWFWLPRSFVRHPGTFTSFERWQDNTDYGYLHIPGTSVDVGIGRGTVYGTLQTRLTRRDYPEYYDSLPVAGDIIEFSDFLSRYGFYPGAHIGIPMAVFGGTEMQFGEALPSIMKTPLDFLIGMFPDNESVKWISERVFGDRFRSYMTMLIVSRMGGDGSLIFTKQKEGEELTPDEKLLWDNARREVGFYSAGFEQFGVFRMRTDEQYQMFKEASAVIEEMTGYTSDQQDWLRKHGYRIWDMVGGMSPTEQTVLQEMDYYRWVGNVRPLLPGRQQEILNKIEIGWNRVANYADDVQDQKLTIQRDFLSAARGPDNYNSMLLDIYDNQRQYIETEIENYPLMDINNRADYYKEFNVQQPVLHPFRELLNLYYSVELKEITDPETGEKVRDWDNFWAQRQAIEDAIPDDYRAEWDDFLSRNSTRMEQVRRDVFRSYFRTYNKVWESILSSYSAGEQALIEEYLHLERTGQQLERQEEIKGTISELTGKSLISGFRSDVSGAKEALRFHNPQLDAWLFYWGKTSSFTSPTGEDAYRELARQTGRRI